jgi:hypothetical protein
MPAQDLQKTGSIKFRHHLAMLCQDTFGLLGEDDELIKNNTGEFPEYPDIYPRAIGYMSGFSHKLFVAQIFNTDY